MDAEVAIVQHDELVTLAILVIRIPQRRLVEIAIVVVNGELIDATSPLVVPAVHIDTAILQERKHRHGDVVRLAIPRLQQRQACLLNVGEHVEVESVHERRNRHIPKDRPNRRQEVEVHRPVKPRLDTKDVPTQVIRVPCVFLTDIAVRVRYVCVQCWHVCPS